VKWTRVPDKGGKIRDSMQGYMTGLLYTNIAATEYLLWDYRRFVNLQNKPTENPNKSKFTTGRSYADNFFYAATSPSRPGLHVIKASRSHPVRQTTPGLRLFWTSEQPNAENSTWQHTIIKTDIHDAGGIRTRNSSKQAAADSRLRPRGHWDQHADNIVV